MPVNPNKTNFAEYIREISPESKEYPYLLGQISRPPHIYMSGRLSPTLFPIAVVGSRKMTEYGRQAVQTIIKGLAGLPVCIISGLAYGIDAEAHQAALANGLPTIAILGSGIDEQSIYPQNHRPLARKIINSGGAIMSEYPPGTPAINFHFPERNRIISGCSKATVVIEADRKSGSLITAQHALEQNRDVFAVPGSIFNKNCQGTNKLLVEGAAVLRDAADIINAYPVLQKYASQLIKQEQQQLFVELPFDNLPAGQAVILRLLNSEPISFGQLLTKSKMPIQQLNSVLTMLEIAGLICKVGAENFVRNFSR